MIILLHVIIALLSIVWASFGYIRPNKTNLRVSYVLVALTFMSGFYLVLSEPAQMVRTCLSGITYLAVVSVGILLTRRKLAALQSDTI
jgi:hypothetical protein